MPTARRSRMIAAPAEELWEVIGDPHHLPRWWPRVTRVEDVEGDAFTEVMRPRKGKLVRADFRLVRADERAHALKWEQRLAGTPFARLLQLGRDEVRASSRERRAARRRGDDRAAPDADGFFPRFGGYHGAPRGRRDDRRGARRPGADQWLSERGPPTMRWWGWGEPDAPAGAARRTRSASCARRSASRRVRARRSRWRACASTPAALATAAARAARDRRRGAACATSTRNACCTPPARATRTSCACARASPRARRTPWCYPACHEQVRAVLELCARDVARGRAVRRRHERGRRRRAAARRARGGGRAGHAGGWATSLELDRESLTVAVQAGMRAPALERQLAAHGLTLGHFPQSYEYVSLGGCAATRSAGQASTRVRGDREDGARACAWRRRPGTSSCRRCRPPPPGPACASC